MKTTILTDEEKKKVYEYHQNLIKNDRGYGGSIFKRVRERFRLSGDQVQEIYNEYKAKK